MKNYQRIVLKLSGEALGNSKYVLSREIIENIFFQVKELKQKYNLQIALVVGGGNIWRGKNAEALNLVPEDADYMGMMATSINALALKSFFCKNGLNAIFQNSLNFESIATKVDPVESIKQLENGTIVIYGGGTGKPFLSTDTAAAMRAIEIKADAILMAKNEVDGIYSDDPNKNPKAKFIDQISFDEIIEKKLQVMDKEAMELLQNKNIDIIVFNINKKNNILNLYEDSKTRKTIVKN